MLDRDDSGINGFLSLPTIHICRNYAAQTSLISIVLAPISWEGMNGTIIYRDLSVYSHMRIRHPNNDIHRISHYIV